MLQKRAGKAGRSGGRGGGGTFRRYSAGGYAAAAHATNSEGVTETLLMRRSPLLLHLQGSRMMTLQFASSAGRSHGHCGHAASVMQPTSSRRNTKREMSRARNANPYTQLNGTGKRITLQIFSNPAARPPRQRNPESHRLHGDDNIHVVTSSTFRK